MIRLLFIFSLLIISYTRVSAQDSDIAETCNCDEVKKVKPNQGKDAFPSLTKAREIFESYRKLFPDFKEKITLYSVTCLGADLSKTRLKKNPARALVCPDKGRYILFQNTNLSEAPYTMFDKFVLAHELGHHMRNFFHDGTSYNYKTGEIIKNNKIKFKFYNKNIIEELQADEVAIYILKKLGNNIDDIIEEIKAREDIATDTHPSSDERAKFIKACYSSIDIRKEFKTQANKNFASEFHDKYNRTVYGLSVEVLAGSILGNNSNFIKDNRIVNAALVSNLASPAFTTGMRFSYININWPIRPEIETTYTKAKFITLDDTKTNKIEDFNFEQINIIPQATFNSLGLTSAERATIPRFGFTASLGYSINIPLQYSYKNYYSGIALLGSDNVKKTGNFSFSVGIERKPIRDELFKYYRLSLRYSPMSLGLKNLSNVSTKSHVVSASLSFRLWK